MLRPTTRLYAETADYYVPNAADAALLMQRCGTGERFTLFTRPYMEGRAVCRAVGEDGTVYVQGNSGITVTVSSYSTEDKSADALQTPSYSDYEVAEPDED